LNHPYTPAANSLHCLDRDGASAGGLPMPLGDEGGLLLTAPFYLYNRTNADVADCVLQYHDTE